MRWNGSARGMTLADHDLTLTLTLTLRRDGSDVFDPNPNPYPYPDQEIIAAARELVGAPGRWGIFGHSAGAGSSLLQPGEWNPNPNPNPNPNSPSWNPNPNPNPNPSLTLTLTLTLTRQLCRVLEAQGAREPHAGRARPQRPNPSLARPLTLALALAPALALP